MPPLNETENNTNSRKILPSASAEKQKEEFDVVEKSPVSAVVNRNSFTPTQPIQETVYGTVRPPIKLCYFKTDPREKFQDVPDRNRATRSAHEFSSSTSVLVSGQDLILTHHDN